MKDWRRSVRCASASNGGEGQQLIGKIMEEIIGSGQSKCNGYKLGKTGLEMLSDGTRKPRDSIYEHVLFLLQS